MMSDSCGNFGGGGRNKGGSGIGGGGCGGSGGIGGGVSSVRNKNS